MYFNGMGKTNFITKKSLTETMKAMPIGGVMRVKSKDFKVSYIRQARNRLNKRGYLFKVTEAGLVDECEIIRLK